AYVFRSAARAFPTWLGSLSMAAGCRSTSARRPVPPSYGLGGTTLARARAASGGIGLMQWGMAEGIARGRLETALADLLALFGGMAPFPHWASSPRPSTD